jgi:hypothetical protein
MPPWRKRLGPHHGGVLVEALHRLGGTDAVVERDERQSGVVGRAGPRPSAIPPPAGTVDLRPPYGQLRRPERRIADDGENNVIRASARNGAVVVRFTSEDNIREVNMAMEDRETFSLIGSDKVEGTNVYGAGGEKVGYIERVMIDKVSGKVSYAVLSFGGLLGVGDDHYPLPWQALKYDTNLGGYVTGITQDQVRGAPKYADESSWNWSDPATTRSVNAYYGVPVA